LAKKTSKFGSAKADPLLQGLPGLEFDNLTAAEITATTDEQKAEAFISRYIESFKEDEDKGASRWKSYFGASVKGEAWELREVKRFFIQLVVSEKWSEEKFVSVVNSIYRDHLVLNVPTLDARGKFFDQGRMSNSPRRGESRRRGRI